MWPRIPHAGDSWPIYISHPLPLINAPMHLKILRKIDWTNLSLALRLSLNLSLALSSYSTNSFSLFVASLKPKMCYTLYFMTTYSWVLWIFCHNLVVMWQLWPHLQCHLCTKNMVSCNFTKINQKQLQEYFANLIKLCTSIFIEQAFLWR